MKLNKAGISDMPQGIELPQFDVEAMISKTHAAPKWIHFGAGNIFRSFIAAVHQQLLNSGEVQEGIIASETYDYEIIDKVYTPFDNLSLLALTEPTGKLQCSLIASVAQSIRGDDFNALKEVFCCPSLQMASFTITEKGYALKNNDNQLFPVVAEDIAKGGHLHTMSMVTALMYERYKSGGAPVALVSMDNCSHNGEKLQDAIMTIAGGWCDNGITDKGFMEYLSDSSRVSFPWTMIDKITPRPDIEVQKYFEGLGFEDMSPVITEKSTYIAPFVNAEVPQYLVVEDSFPNGRPPLEKAGVYFTDRDTVNKVETMKVTTCLNPLHTALAVFGCLLGYTKIADEMRDEMLVKLINKIGCEEGMKVVTNPIIINPEDFLREVLEQRLPNPYIPDTPQRIATDTSQKLGIRFGKTIEAYHSSPELTTDDLKCIPLVLAGWLRYLIGADDKGNAMERSPDPMLDTMDKMLCGIRLGDSICHDRLVPILSDKEIFGVNLYECGLGERVEELFAKMLGGKGAVRQTLADVVGF